MNREQQIYDIIGKCIEDNTLRALTLFTKKEDKDKIVKYIIDKFHLFEDEELIKLVDFLIANKCDLNVKYKTDNLIHLASIFSNLDVIKKLIENGVDPNTKTLDNITPLIYSLRNGTESTSEIIKYLLDAGADVTIKDEEGHNALYYIGYQNTITKKLINNAFKKLKESNTEPDIIEDILNDTDKIYDYIKQGLVNKKIIEYIVKQKPELLDDDRIMKIINNKLRLEWVQCDKTDSNSKGFFQHYFRYY